MARLLVRNFGPIRAGLTSGGGYFDFGKVTVLTGEQGSGKSSVAKLYSTCAWLEKGLFRGELSVVDITQYNRFRKHLAFQGIADYFQGDTRIEYSGDYLHLQYADGKASVTLRNKNHAEPYTVPKLMYVPAERNILALVDDADKLKRLPLPLYTFLDEYDRARKSLKGPVPLPVEGFSYDYDRRRRISYIKGDHYSIKLSNASSGLQSLTPLHIVSLDLSRSLGNGGGHDVSGISLEQKRRLRERLALAVRSGTIEGDFERILQGAARNEAFINVVEEPEQNLYPSSQRRLLASLLGHVNAREGNRLVLTTHSPYLVNYLSLALKAGQLVRDCGPGAEASLRDALPFVEPLDINAGVAVYELSGDGSSRRLPMVHGVPDDGNSLNRYLEGTNDDFDRLLEIEDELCGV